MNETEEATVTRWARVRRQELPGGGEYWCKSCQVGESEEARVVRLARVKKQELPGGRE